MNHTTGDALMGAPLHMAGASPAALAATAALVAPITASFSASSSSSLQLVGAMSGVQRLNEALGVAGGVAPNPHMGGMAPMSMGSMPPMPPMDDAKFDGGALPITTGPAKHKKPLLVVPTKEEVNEDPPAVSNTAVSPVSPVNPVKKANPVAHISLWVTLCLLHTRTTPNPRMLLR